MKVDDDAEADADTAAAPDEDPATLVATAQTRNRYAVAALKRVRHKYGRDNCRLQAPADKSGTSVVEVGRTLDPASRRTVPEHVDRVIGEATSLDNLAQMYGGWSAWI